MDTERTLAFLQGLRACFLVKSLPVLPEEEASQTWLSMEVFSGGLESQAFKAMDSVIGSKYKDDKAYYKPSGDDNRSFINGLVHPEVQNDKATLFISLAQRYCKQKHMILPITEQNLDHPVEKFAHLFIACLLKLHDLVHLATLLVEQHTSTSNEPESPIHFPPALADICKLTHDAKMSLVKARQESSCTYDEICGPAIDRCFFLLDNIRSPVDNVLGMLHRHQIVNMSSRWKESTKKVLTSCHKQTSDRNNIYTNGSEVREEMGSMKAIFYERQQSKETKSLAQVHEVNVYENAVFYSIDKHG